MALYREGKAAMAADGTVTGTGTKWQSSLSLIRPGATIMFLSSPIQMAVVNKVVSDTEIKAITTKGAVVASTDYAILLSDSLTVDGLAQDVAETLRYYQSQETVIADAVEFFKNFDFDSLQNLANPIKADSEAAGASATAAAASESAAKTSETNAKASENSAKTSEMAAKDVRDQVQQIINDAGEQSTLVVLAQPDGYQKIGGLDDHIKSGKIPVDVGTAALDDSVVSGKIDQLLVTVTPGTKDLRRTKNVMPNGNYVGTRILRTRGITKEDQMTTEFELRGQGSNTTILTHSATVGAGDWIYTDYMHNSRISGFMMDNTPLGAGTSNTNTKNGQMWIRYTKDSRFDDLRFAGGDALTFCLDKCKNIMATDLKVDYQLRYPFGTGKSPLIVGDFSEQCMFIGGYVKSVSPDGSVMYSGDLADNDQANDTKWAFINLYGLMFSEKTNSNACMWQEGQDAKSNAHFIGMNYIGNGVGHGVSEKAMGTDIGSTFRQAQVRAVWNRSRYITIGSHYLDNLAEYPAGTGGNSAAAGGIHCDNPTFMSSIGDYFEGNIRDLQDYTGATEPNPANSVHLTGNRHGASLSLSANGLTQHLGLVNSQLSAEAKLAGGGNGRLHVSVVASHCVGSAGSFGHGQSRTVMDVIGSTFSNDGGAGPMITQTGVGVISFSKCVINDYTSVVAAYNFLNVSFESCTFNRVTFTSDDLKAKYINCRFINCTNAPDTKGLNFAADSTTRPSSARWNVTLQAGETYTVPSWLMQARGVYDFTVGGNGANQYSAKGFIAKRDAVSAGAVTMQFESNPGGITVEWPSNGSIAITVSQAGNYTMRLS